jgi:hypothetical protein
LINHSITGTGPFQPADVGLQRLIKHRLRQQTLAYLVDQFSQQIKTGLSPEQVKFATNIGPLRDATVSAIEGVYDWLSSADGRQIVRRAWEKSAAHGLNLGMLDYKTLVGHHEELKRKIGDVYGIDELHESDEAGGDDDHTDVPTEVLVQQLLGLDLRGTPGEDRAFCVDPGNVVADADGDLVADAPDEDVWVYDYKEGGADLEAHDDVNSAADASLG